MTLLYITLPFAALAIGLLAAGEVFGSGWDKLDYLVYAMATGVLWATVVVVYLVWVVVRDGWQPSSFPAIAVLATLGLLAAGWWYREHAAEADCRAAVAFYQALATLPAADRADAIRTGSRFVTAPSSCAIDGLRLAFGRPVLLPDLAPSLPDAERWSTLELLLNAGMPPDGRILYGFAVDDADPTVSRLLLRRRKALNSADAATWDLFPDDIVQPLLTRARTAPGTVDPNAERYRATLAVLVDEGLTAERVLSTSTRRELDALGLLSGIPSRP